MENIKSKKLNTEIIFNDFYEFERFTQSRRTIFITDENVNKYYKSYLKNHNTIVLAAGERSKNHENVNMIYDELIRSEIDRHSIIVGIGGGVVTDITGFVASTYMRGTPFILMPTSLLAMADAAIGGKNGINYADTKNLIGCITQPELTFIDNSFLYTLENQHYFNGLSEIIKMGFIAEPEILNIAHENTNAIINRDLFVVKEMIYLATKAKIKIVEKDTNDKSLRQLLNFGHTFGHAIEMKDGILHGLAVSRGMYVAMKTSHELGYLSKKDIDYCLELLKKLNLPVKFRYSDAYIDYLKRDKKKNSDIINFILLKRPGEAFSKDFKIDKLKSLLYDS